MKLVRIGRAPTLLTISILVKSSVSSSACTTSWISTHNDTDRPFAPSGTMYSPSGHRSQRLLKRK